MKCNLPVRKAQKECRGWALCACWRQPSKTACTDTSGVRLHQRGATTSAACEERTQRFAVLYSLPQERMVLLPLLKNELSLFKTSQVCQRTSRGSLWKVLHSSVQLGEADIKTSHYQKARQHLFKYIIKIKVVSSDPSTSQSYIGFTIIAPQDRKYLHFWYKPNNRPGTQTKSQQQPPPTPTHTIQLFWKENTCTATSLPLKTGQFWRCKQHG